MNKILRLAVWPVMMVPVVYLFTCWKILPEKIALHFRFDGTPNRFGDKSELFIITLIFTAISVAIYFLIANIYKIDPKKYAAENKDRLHRMAFVLVVFMAVVNCLIIYASAERSFQLSARYLYAALGLLFCILGNYMYNIKPNYFVGFRIPWTLNNEENWRRTHLAGGKLWFGGGLLITFISLLSPSIFARTAFNVILIIIVIVPVFYSYNLYRKGK